MVDPCEQCIIAPMCNEECDSLVEYLSLRSKRHISFCKWIASGIRQNELIYTKSSIRRRSDGKSVLYMYSK